MNITLYRQDFKTHDGGASFFDDVLEHLSEYDPYTDFTTIDQVTITVDKFISQDRPGFNNLNLGVRG